MTNKCIFFLVILTLFDSCKKDKSGLDPNRIYTNSQTVYTSPLPMGGSCIDAEGNLIVFNPPTFAYTSGNVGNFIKSPAMIKLSSNGTKLQEYPLPANKWQYYRGSCTVDTIDGILQGWNDELKVSLALNKQKQIINSNSVSQFVSSYSSNTNNLIVQLGNLSAIALDADDNIVALSSPIYNEDRTISTPPEIWKITSDGNLSLFYTFPTSYNYAVGNMWGNGQSWFSLNKPEDLYISKKGFMYVALGNASKVVRISPAGQMEEILSDISSPVSIVVDEFENIFVVSSQLMDDLDFSIAKQLQVIEIKPNKSRTIIYTGIANKINANSSFKDIITGKWSVLSDQTDLNISSNGDVYLLEPFERKIIRIY